MYNVPIIQDAGLEMLLKTIKNNNAMKILEIGSAIGYSAIQMANINENIEIITLEIDEVRYNEAINNIYRLNKQNQIKIYLQDALTYETNEQFDFIFIDAAKGQYTKFFERFQHNLKQNGIIFTDNLLFHGLVNNSNQIKSRNLKQLVKKIEKFREYLKNNINYETTFLDVGDGIAISKKL